MHIHAVVEECEIVELLKQIDPKTKKPMKKKVLFVKNGAVVLCRIQVSLCFLFAIRCLACVFIFYFIFSFECHEYTNSYRKKKPF